MGVFLFSLKMLKKEYKKSFMYAFTLMFTIAVCFIFFNILENPLLKTHEAMQGGGSWAQMSVPITTGLAFLVIMFCSAMIIFANNFFLTKKTKEIAIMTMSGANFIDMTLYLLYQNLVIILIVMPIGLLIGYLSSIISNQLMYHYLNIQGSIYQTSVSAFFNTFASICAMLFAVLIYSSGYIYRHDIQYMLSTQTVNEYEDKRIIRFPPQFYICLYIFGIILMMFSTYYVSVFIFPCLIGIIGGAGLLKYSIPNFFTKLKRRKYINHQILLVSISNLSYSLKKSIFLVSLYTISSASMIALLVSQQNNIKDFITIVIGYAVIIMLLSIGLLYKYSSEAMNRKIFFYNLYKLGYTRKKIKTIIKYEVLLYYFLMILMPLIYIFIILIRCYLHSDISMAFGLILLCIEILPPCFICLLTYFNYKKTVLNVIEEGVHYE